MGSSLLHPKHLLFPFSATNPDRTQIAQLKAIPDQFGGSRTHGNGIR